MTVVDKLKFLYSIKDRLHPLTRVLVESFSKESWVLSNNDRDYIEEIFDIMSKETEK